jgi:hypothetical protein
MVEIRFRGSLITWIGGLTVTLDDGEVIQFTKHPGHMWDPKIEGEDSCNQRGCNRTDTHSVYRIDGRWVDVDCPKCHGEGYWVEVEGDYHSGFEQCQVECECVKPVDPEPIDPS